MSKQINEHFKYFVYLPKFYNWLYFVYIGCLSSLSGNLYKARTELATDFYHGHLTVYLSNGPLIYILICLEESSSDFNFDISPCHLPFTLLFLKIICFIFI